MPLKVTERLEERINSRWLIWHPWCLVLARKRLPFVATEITLGQCRTLHRDRYIQAMAQHIPEPTIRRQGLDDPRLDMEGFRIKMEEALRQRAFRIGRVKGVKRTHKQIRQELKEKQVAHI